MVSNDGEVDDNLESVPRRVYQSLRELLEEGAVGDQINVLVADNPGPPALPVPLNIEVYCHGPNCGRRMVLIGMFDKEWHGCLILDRRRECSRVLDYRCGYAACQKIKSFLLRIEMDASFGTRRRVIKAGEWPPMGEPLPPALLEIAGKASDMLINGYACELEGKGIAAYAYYRRFVVFRTREFVAKCLEVAKRENASEPIIRDLKNALKATNYKAILDGAKKGLPQRLFFGGTNPLLCIHELISGEMKSKSDSQCMSEATQIRVLLAFLAQTVHDVIANDDAVRVALDEAQKRTNRGKAFPQGDGLTDSDATDKDGS